jgi:antitoxin PrlF
MPEATVTGEGQVLLPKEVRDALCLEPGDPIEFVVRSPDEVILRRPRLDIKDLKGCLYRPGQRAVSIEEMNEAVRDYPRL